MITKDTDVKLGSDYAIAGAVSGFMTRFICQPFDVIKIRFQLQVEPISHKHPSKYRSFIHAALTISKEEGVLSLWKGHVPAQLLSICYGTIQFYSYAKMMEHLQEVSFMNNWQHSMQFIAGAGAGSLATIVSFPFDTARTRLVAQSSNKKIYSGPFAVYESMFRTESPRSLFKGLLPTLIQVAPNTGLQFFIYNLLTTVYQNFSTNSSTSIVNSMLAGSMSGLLAKTAVYPMDLARKRLQIQGFEHGRVGFGKFFSCQGLLDCLLKTFKGEGIRGLFKGMIPSLLKAASTSALHFTFYEQALTLLQHMHL